MISTESLVDISQKLITSLAVVIGGGWAYLKFIRGRVYAPRVELAVSVSLFRTQETQLLLCRVAAENRGLTRIRLQPHRQLVYLYCGQLSAVDGIVAPRLEKTAVTLVFEGHRWIEAQERVCEDVQFHVPAGSAEGAAYRVEVELWQARGRRRYGRRWLTSATLLGEGWRPASIDPARLPG